MASTETGHSHNNAIYADHEVFRRLSGKNPNGEYEHLWVSRRSSSWIRLKWVSMDPVLWRQEERRYFATARAVL